MWQKNTPLGRKFLDNFVYIQKFRKRLPWETAILLRMLTHMPHALMYKIVHGQVAVPVDSLKLTPKDKRTRTNHKHRHLPAQTDPARYFFTNRTIPDWNVFPASTTEIPPVVSFKTQLHWATAIGTRQQLERRPEY